MARSRPCGACQGTGKQRCGTCQGVGVVGDGIDAKGRAKTKRCGNCNGSGTRGRCGTCGGKGRLEGHNY